MGSMSTASDAADQAALADLRAKEARGRGVEELDDEMDPQQEDVLQRRLVELGRKRGIGARKGDVEGTRTSTPA
jgi:hypothetical protein